MSGQRGPLLVVSLLAALCVLARADHTGEPHEHDEFSVEGNHTLDDGHGHQHCACHARKHGWALHCRNSTNDTVATALTPTPFYAAAAFEALTSAACFPELQAVPAPVVPSLAIEESLLVDANMLAMSLPARALSLESRLELAATVEWIANMSMTCQQWFHVLQAHHDDCPAGEGLDPFMERGYHFLPDYERCESDFMLEIEGLGLVVEDGDDGHGHSDGDEDHSDDDPMPLGIGANETGALMPMGDTDAPVSAAAATDTANETLTDTVPLLCAPVGDCAEVDDRSEPLAATLSLFNCTEGNCSAGICQRAFHSLFAWHAKCPNMGFSAAVSFHEHEGPCGPYSCKAFGVDSVEEHDDDHAETDDHDEWDGEDCGGYPLP